LVGRDAHEHPDHLGPVLECPGGDDDRALAATEADRHHDELSRAVAAEGRIGERHRSNASGRLEPWRQPVGERFRLGRLGDVAVDDRPLEHATTAPRRIDADEHQAGPGDPAQRLRETRTDLLGRLIHPVRGQ
jgi:hypothetical protein